MCMGRRSQIRQTKAYNSFLLAIIHQRWSLAPFLDELPFFDIEGVKVGWLDICFIEDEVFDEVKNTSDDKALRLDDFSMAFFQA